MANDVSSPNYGDIVYKSYEIAKTYERYIFFYNGYFSHITNFYFLTVYFFKAVKIGNMTNYTPLYFTKDSYRRFIGVMDAYSNAFAVLPFRSYSNSR